MHTLFKGGAEGAVAVVAALLGQLLGDNGVICSGISFFIIGVIACKNTTFSVK